MRALLQLSLLASLAGAVAPASAQTQTDKYNVTPEEHAACDADVYRLCSDSEDEDQVLTCMKVHRSDLSAKCQSTFDAGLKRRHLKS